MLVGRQNFERVLVVCVAPAHARGGKRVAYERVNEEIRVRAGQCRERVRVIVQLVANGSTNPPSTVTMRQQQNVSTAEVVQSLDLFGDSGRDVLTRSSFPDLCPNRIAPDTVPIEGLGHGPGAIGADREYVVGSSLRSRGTGPRPERHEPNRWLHHMGLAFRCPTLDNKRETREQCVEDPVTLLV